MPRRSRPDPHDKHQVPVPRVALAPMSDAEMRRAISGREPRDLTRYVMQARTNVAYVAGTGVIDLKQFQLGIGRHLVDEPRLPDHNTYITLDEYLVTTNRRQLGF